MKLFSFLALLFFLVNSSLYSQIDVINTPAATYGDPSWLVNNILAGSGVSISNVTFSGQAEQIGYFDGSNTNIGLDAGIVMSCGDNSSLIPPSNFNNITGGVVGEPDLLTIANSVPPLIGETFTVSEVNDVAILEFDFTPIADTVQFNYVFSSEEYYGFENTSYNDVFAFFISGPGITGPYASPAGFPNGAKNIAFIPGTNPELPITISSVNLMLNDQYFVDNSSFATVDRVDGFTTKLTAVSGVQCNQTYHIKLAIADGSDASLISAIFLEAASFSSPSALSIVPVTSNGDNTIIEGCGDSTEILFSRTDPNLVNDTVSFELSGSAVNGVDYSPISDTVIFNPGELSTSVFIEVNDDLIEEGMETILFVTTSISDCGDTISDTTELFIGDPYDISVVIEDPLSCSNDSIGLSAVIPNTLTFANYAWNTGGTTPSINVPNNNAGIYSVTVDDAYNCINEASIDIGQVVIPSAEFSVEINASCDNDQALVHFEATELNGNETQTNWHFTNDTNVYEADSLNLLMDYAQTIIASFVTSNAFNCKDSNAVLVEIGAFNVHQSVVPNVFSPNDDGMNDYFSFRSYKHLGDCLEFEILSRWGKQVFKSEKGQLFWDGKNKEGKEVPEGTYYYILDFKGEIETGYIQLIR